MAHENICKWEKFGYCRKKKDCTDYHPSEVCREEVCNVSKCHKRHPQPCRFFRFGSCKFGESCKYDHKKQLNDKEHLERIKQLELNNKEHIERIQKLEANEKKQDEKIQILEINEKEQAIKVKNLEIENKKITDLSIKQADSILNLHSRLNHLEKEYVIILKNQSKEIIEQVNKDEEVKMDEGTLECDDQTKSNEQVDENVTDVSKEQFDLEVDIQHTKNNLSITK